MKKIKKVKETTARILLVLILMGFGYIVIDRLFVDPISEVFRDNPVTVGNIIITIIVYLVLVILLWLLYIFLEWILKNI